jgi:hypothetical protein
LVTVVHELGHTLHFGHTFSGQTAGTWAEYDDPIDVMSKAGDRTRLMATTALNRYIAGWVDPADVVIAGGGGSYTLSALGRSGDELLLVPNGEQGWYTAIDVRLATGFDSVLPQAGVTVHVLDQRAEACGSALPCFGLSRRVSQWPAIADSYDHVLAPGEELTLPNGWVLSVVERVGDQFVVALADTDAPVFPGPVVATGVETSSVSLSWPAALDGGLIAYDVAVGSRTPFSTFETSAVVAGLAPDQDYTIRVTARDASGNQVPADPVVIRTLSTRDKWVVHEPAFGRWVFRLGEGIEDAIYYGVPGDVALLCDWNGNGSDTVGLYRPSEGFVYLRNSNTLGFADVDFFFGIPTDVPLCGDWDGDGTDTVGVYRPAAGRFFLRNSNSLGFADVDFAFGSPGDRPLAGDWDGDGIDTVAMWRPSAGIIHGIDGELWPAPSGSRLIVGDYSGTGRDGFASYAEGVITVVDGAGAQQLIRFGTAGTVALTGWWD